MDFIKTETVWLEYMNDIKTKYWNNIECESYPLRYPCYVQKFVYEIEPNLFCDYLFLYKEDIDGMCEKFN